MAEIVSCLGTISDVHSVLWVYRLINKTRQQMGNKMEQGNDNGNLKLER